MVGINNILTIHQIPGSVIDLIDESEEYCFLITPYFKPWQLLYRALDKAAMKNKKIVFIFRAENGITQEMAFVHEEFGHDIVLVDRLHTKLYLNENKVIISSMNLYDNSKENNYEVGYIFKGKSHSRKFKERIIDNDILSLEPAVILEGRYFESLRKENNEKSFNGYKRNDNNSKKVSEDVGYCIRCRSRINKNPHYPLCPDCYNIWSNFSNPNYTENYCHFCGEEAYTSKNKPVCSECGSKG